MPNFQIGWVGIALAKVQIESGSNFSSCSQGTDLCSEGPRAVNALAVWVCDRLQEGLPGVMSQVVIGSFQGEGCYG